jgi:hypothetical protein
MESNQNKSDSDRSEWHPPEECDIPDLERGDTFDCSCGRTWLGRYSSYHDRIYYEITTPVGALTSDIAVYSHMNSRNPNTETQLMTRPQQPRTDEQNRSENNEVPADD